MAEWSRNKVDSSILNDGNEYTVDSQLSLEALNGMVNAGLYAQDFAEALADSADTSEANVVGTPSVSFIDYTKNGKTYKKFKFSNLKGATGDKGDQGIQGIQGLKGDKGDKGDTGTPAGFGTPTSSVAKLPAGSTPSVYVTTSGANTAKVFDFAFSIPEATLPDNAVAENVLWESKNFKNIYADKKTITGVYDSSKHLKIYFASYEQIFCMYLKPVADEGLVYEYNSRYLHHVQAITNGIRINQYKLTVKPSGTDLNLTSVLEYFDIVNGTTSSGTTIYPINFYKVTEVVV